MKQRYAKASLVVSTGLALAISGCFQAPVAANFPAKIAVDAVQVSGGVDKGRTLEITILPASAATFATQAVIHKWVDNDIFEYRVALKFHDGKAFVDMQQPLGVVVPRKGNAKNKAVFSNLKQGFKYQVEMLAYGNNGGGLASTLLTTLPTTSIYDFTGLNDVEDTVIATLRVVFDQVAFSGNGSAAVAAPADGAFKSPGVAEGGASDD